MAVRSKYQGKPGTDKNGKPTDVAYYLVNPAGAVHSCTLEHLRWRLNNPKYRIATDAEIEQFLERDTQLSDAPIAEPWSPEPVFLPDVPEAEELPEKPLATPKAEELAVEKGVDLTKVTGTGANGQILVADVEKHAESGKK